MAKLILTGSLQLSAPAIISGTMAAGYSGSYAFDAIGGEGSAWPVLSWSSVGHSGVLTNYTGDTSPNSSTTLQNYRFTSTITQPTSCASLTIRNCHFDLSLGANYALNNSYNVAHSNDLLVEDCTFEGTNSAQVLVGGSGSATFRRCRFRDAKTDFVKQYSTGDRLYEACYFGGASRTVVPPEDFHADGFQNEMGSGGTVIMRGCTWDMPPAVGGLVVRITPGSYLEADGIAAGLTGDQLKYKGSITYFSFQNDAATHTFEYNHLLKMGSNGFQKKVDVNPACTYRFLGNRFYPAGIYSTRTGTSYGTWTNLGDNLWAASGQDLTGVSRTAGTAVF